MLLTLEALKSTLLVVVHRWRLLSHQAWFRADFVRKLKGVQSDPRKSLLALIKIIFQGVLLYREIQSSGTSLTDTFQNQHWNCVRVLRYFMMCNLIVIGITNCQEHCLRRIQQNAVAYLIRGVSIGYIVVSLYKL